ncbi:MAG: homoserine kinase [Conexivisphaera sp.]
MRIIAPASSANLGPGYDVLSVALDGIYDVVDVKVEEGSGISIDVRGRYAEGVPEDPERNSAGVAAAELIRAAGVNVHVHISLRKEIPPSSGLGSSGAGAAGVAYALNRMLGLGMDNRSLVEFAGRGERTTAGTAHYDNVTASLLGWFNVVRPEVPPSVVNLRPPRGARISFALAVPMGPRRRSKTKLARELVPHEVPMDLAVWNTASVAMIVSGILMGDARLLGAGMADRIVEPARSKMIPGYAKAREAALSAGALGVTISGAGPSMIAVTPNDAVSRKVADAMASAMEEEGTRAIRLTSRPGPGCREDKVQGV